MTTAEINLLLNALSTLALLALVPVCLFSYIRIHDLHLFLIQAVADRQAMLSEELRERRRRQKEAHDASQTSS